MNNEQSCHPESSKPQRRYDLDWLRVLAVLLVIPMHTALVFGMRLLDIPTVAAGRSNLLAILAGFIYPWHMPLLLLISGAATWFLLRSRTVSQYLLRRSFRLIPPMLFAILVLIPPLAFVQFLGRPGYPTNFFAFYPRFFTRLSPEGPFTWLHMWFVAYLLIFSLVSAPLFVYLNSRSGQRLISKLAAFAESRGGIFLLFLPLAAIEIGLRARWPGVQNLIDDVANDMRYLTFFLYGYLFMTNKRFTKAIARQAPAAFGIGVLTATLLVLQWVVFKIPAPPYSLTYAIGYALWAFNGWTWLIAVLGFGYRYLSKPSKPLGYAGEAALPVYVLHLPINLAIGFYMVRWDTHLVLKYFLVTTTTIITTYAIYEVCFRRFRLMRRVLGMNPKRPVQL